MGILGANLVSGLVLGLLFRLAHALVRSRLHLPAVGRPGPESTAQRREPPVSFPHVLRGPR
jgi:hypothetical protein